MSDGNKPRKRLHIHLGWTAAGLGLALIPHAILGTRIQWVSIHVGATVTTGIAAIVVWCASTLGQRLESGAFGADDVRQAYCEGRVDARATDLDKLQRRRHSDR